MIFKYTHGNARDPGTINQGLNKTVDSPFQITRGIGVLRAAREKQHD